jgi:hypothetical protein
MFNGNQIWFAVDLFFIWFSPFTFGTHPLMRQILQSTSQDAFGKSKEHEEQIDYVLLDSQLHFQQSPWSFIFLWLHCTFLNFLGSNKDAVLAGGVAQAVECLHSKHRLWVQPQYHQKKNRCSFPASVLRLKHSLLQALLFILHRATEKERRSHADDFPICTTDPPTMGPQASLSDDLLQNSHFKHASLTASPCVCDQDQMKPYPQVVTPWSFCTWGGTSFTHTWQWDTLSQVNLCPVS